MNSKLKDDGRMEMEETEKAQEVRIGLKEVDQNVMEGNNIKRGRTRIQIWENRREMREEFRSKMQAKVMKTKKICWSVAIKEYFSKMKIWKLK